jgi:hypothetical protein
VILGANAEHAPMLYEWVANPRRPSEKLLERVKQKSGIIAGIHGGIHPLAGLTDRPHLIKITSYDTETFLLGVVIK